MACEAADRARINEDKKGIADASLIAARAGLRLIGHHSTDQVMARSVRSKLIEAESLYVQLGQRLGSAQTCFGIEEFSRRFSENDEEVEWNRRGQAMLSLTSSYSLPTQFSALP